MALSRSHAVSLKYQNDLKLMDATSFEEGPWPIIADGGFSQVWKAKHRQWGFNVAIKSLNLGPLKGLHSIADLKREAHFMMCAAECPYSIRVMGLFGGFVPGAGVYTVGLVMEMMETSLASLLKDHRPPWPLVFRLAHQVALGMNYLHCLEPALIHKDLKPGNILLDSGLNVKITDFGLTRSDNCVTLDRNKTLETAFYAPPEASQGRATYAYDVYSYAMLLYKILNTRPGYTDPDFNKSTGERPSLDYVKGLEVNRLKRLVDLMVKCWNQTPDQRPRFKYCVDVTEQSYEVQHKEGIHDAVSEVQKDLHGDGGPVVENTSGTNQDTELKELRTKMAEMSVELQLHKDTIAALERDAGPPAGSRNRRDFLKYVCELTLDPNTAYGHLSLSENNRKVERAGRDQHYPPHADRFMDCAQVMCKEPLSGRCYSEVQCSGEVVAAVTHRRISKRGHDSVFGYNDLSWSLDCDDVVKRYTVRHNDETTVLPVSPSSSSNRVAVYVDHAAGTVSFYAVSSDTLTHLHTFQSTFTGPLYVGFRVGMMGGSVSL